MRMSWVKIKFPWMKRHLLFRELSGFISLCFPIHFAFIRGILRIGGNFYFHFVFQNQNMSTASGGWTTALQSLFLYVSLTHVSCRVPLYTSAISSSLIKPFSRSNLNGVAVQLKWQLRPACSRNGISLPNTMVEETIGSLQQYRKWYWLKRN